MCAIAWDAVCPITDDCEESRTWALANIVSAPGFALLVPPVSVSVSVPAALPAAVPVSAVPPPLFFVAAAALAFPATVAPSGLVTAAWSLISLGLVCASYCPNCWAQKHGSALGYLGHQPETPGSAEACQHKILLPAKLTGHCPPAFGQSTIG